MAPIFVLISSTPHTNMTARSTVNITSSPSANTIDAYASQCGCYQFTTIDSSDMTIHTVVHASINTTPHYKEIIT